MKARTKDRIKGCLTFAFCVGVSVLFFSHAQAKPTTWHIIILPLLPPIIYPTW